MPCCLISHADRTRSHLSVSLKNAQECINGVTSLLSISKKTTLFSNVHSVTARSGIVCCLRMCNIVTVRHRRTFYNDQGFRKRVKLIHEYPSVLLRLLLDIPYQGSGRHIYNSALGLI